MAGESQVGFGCVPHFMSVSWKQYDHLIDWMVANFIWKFFNLIVLKFILKCMKDFDLSGSPFWPVQSIE
jgi:hypothetical protein